MKRGIRRIHDCNGNPEGNSFLTEWEFVHFISLTFRICLFLFLWLSRSLSQFLPPSLSLIALVTSFVFLPVCLSDNPSIHLYACLSVGLCVCSHVSLHNGLREGRAYQPDDIHLNWDGRTDGQAYQPNDLHLNSSDANQSSPLPRPTINHGCYLP